MPSFVRLKSFINFLQNENVARITTTDVFVYSFRGYEATRGKQRLFARHVEMARKVVNQATPGRHLSHATHHTQVSNVKQQTEKTCAAVKLPLEGDVK